MVKVWEGGRIDQIVVHATHRWRGAVFAAAVLTLLVGGLLLSFVAPPSEPGPEPGSGAALAACDAVWPDDPCRAALPDPLGTLPSIAAYASQRAVVQLEQELRAAETEAPMSGAGVLVADVWGPFLGVPDWRSALRKLEDLARRNRPPVPEPETARGTDLGDVVDRATVDALAALGASGDLPTPEQSWAWLMRHKFSADRREQAVWRAWQAIERDVQTYVALRRESFAPLWQAAARESEQRHAAWAGEVARFEAYQRRLPALWVGVGSLLVAVLALGLLDLALAPVPVTLSLHQIRIGKRCIPVEDVVGSLWTEVSPGVALRDGRGIRLPRHLALAPHDREVLDLFTTELLAARGGVREVEPGARARLGALLARRVAGRAV